MSDFQEHFEGHLAAVREAMSALEPASNAAAGEIIAAIRGGHKVLCFGNGGSASQASHMVGELIGRFKETRRPYAAVSLVSDPGAMTCIANDFGYAAVFERQVEGLAQPGDVAIGLSTSGTSENVLRALIMASSKGARTIALTGARGLVGAEADHVLAVPSTSTAHVQELHLMLLHIWCIGIDAALGASE